MITVDCADKRAPLGTIDTDESVVDLALGLADDEMGQVERVPEWEGGRCRGRKGKVLDVVDVGSQRVEDFVAVGSREVRVSRTVDRPRQHGPRQDGGGEGHGSVDDGRLFEDEFLVFHLPIRARDGVGRVDIGLGEFGDDSTEAEIVSTPVHEWRAPVRAGERGEGDWTVGRRGDMRDEMAAVETAHRVCQKVDLGAGIQEPLELGMQCSRTLGNRASGRYPRNDNLIAQSPQGIHDRAPIVQLKGRQHFGRLVKESETVTEYGDVSSRAMRIMMMRQPLPNTSNLWVDWLWRGSPQPLESAHRHRYPVSLLTNPFTSTSTPIRLRERFEEGCQLFPFRQFDSQEAWQCRGHCRI